MASLTWQSFNLNDSMPSVKVLAAYSKHRRDDTLPLRCDIAKQLAMWKDKQTPDERSKVFAVFAPNKAAKMLRKDLEAAGIIYKDDANRYVDFHSLRHSFISNLTRSGVSPKIAQSLARHSTIGLTMDTYTHIGLYDERTALDSLPELPSLDSYESEGNKAATVKTGTDDLPVAATEIAYKPAYKKLTKNAYSEFDRSSLIDTEQNKEHESEQSGKSLETVVLGSKRNRMSPLGTEKNNRRRWDSNPRITVLQTVALDHLATPPILDRLFSLRVLDLFRNKNLALRSRKRSLAGRGVVIQIFLYAAMAASKTVLSGTLCFFAAETQSENSGLAFTTLPFSRPVFILIAPNSVCTVTKSRASLLLCKICFLTPNVTACSKNSCSNCWTSSILQITDT